MSSDGFSREEVETIKDGLLAMDHTKLYYPVDGSYAHNLGWKIDSAMGMLVIGRGPGRTLIPLCNVRAIQLIPRGSDD